MNVTPARIERIKEEYTRIAGEEIVVEQITSNCYIFASELATLRLFRKMPKGQQGYSANMKTFYFSFEL